MEIWQHSPRVVVVRHSRKPSRSVRIAPDVTSPGSWPVQRLLVTGYGSPHVQRHVEYALAAGMEVLQVGREPIYPLAPPLRYSFAALAEVVSWDVQSQRFQSDSSRSESYQNAVAAESTRLRAAADAFAPDIIHAVGMDFTADVCAYAGLRPLVVSALGFLEYLVYQGVTTLDPQDRALLAGTAALIVEPPMLAERLRAIVPGELPLFVLSAGLNAQHFRTAAAAERTAWRRALRLPEDAFVVLSPRGWAPSYNHHHVLAAFAAALPKLAPPAFLLFVQMGRSAVAQRALDYYDQVQAQAAALGVGAQVRWLPAFPAVSMAMLYNVADVVVSYRTPDTFPVTVLEALACARPVIAPRLPTFQDSVIERCCTLAPPNDPPALAAALLELAARPPTAEYLTAARAAVIAAHDRPVVMEKIGAIYEAAHQQR